MDTTIYDAAEALRLAVHNALIGCCVQRFGISTVVVGPAAADDCCEGQLTVSVDRIYPANAVLGESVSIIDKCNIPWTGVDMTVQVLRCAPTLNDDGSPPTAAELAASARQVFSEAHVVWTTVLCYLYENRHNFDGAIRQQIMLEPGGGCVGSQLTLTIALDEGCQCDG